MGAGATQFFLFAHLPLLKTQFQVDILIQQPKGGLKNYLACTLSPSLISV
jgi:hypothetical protein